jgi:mRNA interferase MazF
MSLQSRYLGDFGKPRPAVVLQQRIYPETENVTIALITSDLSRATHIRISVDPDGRNGLRKPSEIMVDNLQTLRVQRIGAIIGSLDDATMGNLKRALVIFFGIDQ